MEKYEKLFKGLGMCAGPDCNPECPYHGETRGGKTCRAWLLNDAAAALAAEEGRAASLMERCSALRDERNALRDEVAALAEALELAEDNDRPVEQKKPEPGLAETMEIALKATADASYWRGRSEALEWCFRFYFGDEAEPDLEATGDV